MLALRTGPAEVARDALCDSLHGSSPYWSMRQGPPNLHVLESLFDAAVEERYLARTDGDPDAARRLMADEGIAKQDGRFEHFVGALLAMRVHLPNYPIVHYKGGGFSCSYPP